MTISLFFDSLTCPAVFFKAILDREKLETGLLVFLILCFSFSFIYDFLLSTSLILSVLISELSFKSDNLVFGEII